MTIAFWCVLVAGLLPYIAVGIAKWDPTYMANNGEPRAWEAKLGGIQSRAHAAHLNGFEAFPLFAAGVVIASLCQAAPATVDAIAAIFVATRVIYIAAYLANADKVRSLIWTAGLVCCIALFVVAGRA
jgi:uncharacterized MAPEG superfamily protein